MKPSRFSWRFFLFVPIMSPLLWLRICDNEGAKNTEGVFAICSTIKAIALTLINNILHLNSPLNLINNLNR